MNDRIQIFTDEKGNKRSVIVPYEEWTELKARVKRLENKLKVFSGIRNGAHEVMEARRSGKKLQTLASFIDESRD